ncbi:hypothetical protein MLD38_004445 [Melastoma candidum]|uniref:Uncharacterized protein n=1 Tax=Melastoma candidum TaxID=119954 RepID=A0ACB9S5M0_9MYRT|nr:hypothetical protein MLD38_004445 [Melastoma candidum]
MDSSARSRSSSAYHGAAWKDEMYGHSAVKSGVWSLGEDCVSHADTERESDFDASLLNDETRQPLSRKVPVPPPLINPYRMVIAFRFAALGLFFYWRLGNPVRNAYVLWLMSVVCEIWLAMSWILEQLTKWRPVKRETYLERLAVRYNRREPSQLAGIDVIVMAADPRRESPIMTANTLLSVLAVDYPVDKISCYISDEGSSMLTFEAVQETSEFARKWVPFCKKYCIEPRSPEQYFSLSADYLRNKVHPSFIKDRRAMKREYEEFKVYLNRLVARAKKAPREGWVMKDGTPWPGNNARDHPGIIQVFLGQGGGHDMDGKVLPRLIYVSREIRPGFQHHGKAGAMNALVRVSGIFTNSPFILNLDCSQYINNSKALQEAMCFLMDPKYGDYTAFVQFPLKLDRTDRNNSFESRNNVFFDVNLRCLDGVQGPLYIGTACVFNRRCLYGYEAPRKIKHGKRNCLKTCLGRSRNMDSNLSKESEMELLGKQRAPRMPISDVDSIRELVPTEEANQDDNLQLHQQKLFGKSQGFIESVPLQKGTISQFLTLESLLREAIQVISCGYEDDTKWGREIGWIYGSGSEEFLVGLKVQSLGWRSIYCTPRIPAFRELATVNLLDHLNRSHDWAKGSICLLFSQHCPLWNGCDGRLKLLQRFAYINCTVYPLTALPLVVFCILPSLCLFSGKFVLPQIDITGCIALTSLFFTILATNVLEMRWGEIGIHEWWRNEQFSVIVAVSAHLFAVVHGLIKVLLNIDIKVHSSHDESSVNKEPPSSDPYILRWTSLLIPPMALLMINLVAIVAGISSAISNGNQAWSVMFCKLVLASSVILHLLPFVGGLTSNRNRLPTIVLVWSVLLASIFSLLWLHVNPFATRMVGPSIEQCGINC